MKNALALLIAGFTVSLTAGDLTGTVTLKGTPPAEKDITPLKEDATCGKLAGAATACLLRRRNPGLRVLILERSERFKRRVGESTVEISALFLGRVLGLLQRLFKPDAVAVEILPNEGLLGKGGSS